MPQAHASARGKHLTAVTACTECSCSFVLHSAPAHVQNLQAHMGSRTLGNRNATLWPDHVPAQIQLLYQSNTSFRILSTAVQLRCSHKAQASINEDAAAWQTRPEKQLTNRETRKHSLYKDFALSVEHLRRIDSKLRASTAMSAHLQAGIRSEHGAQRHGATVAELVVTDIQQRQFRVGTESLGKDGALAITNLIMGEVKPKQGSSFGRDHRSQA